MFEGKRILIGVTSSAAMYKTLYLIRSLKKQGADVHVMMSRYATQLISPQLFHAISGNKVWAKMFDDTADDPMPHVQVLQNMDAVAIVPATASIIGRYAMGLADDLMTTTLLGAKAPVLVAPAMNTLMFQHPIVQDNLEKLRSIGVTVVEPAEGLLACGVEGKGLLASMETIEWNLLRCLTAQDWEGKKVLISAGRTEEPIDPVRVLTNRSSGKMGLALAQAAYVRGAEVTVVLGPHEVDYPDCVTQIPVQTAEEMLDAVKTYFSTCDVFLSAAAVCDYRPQETSSQKVKKSGETWSLDLVQNPDILRIVSAMKRPDQRVVGFALESIDLKENAQKKLIEKELDLIVGNSPSILGVDEGEFELFYGREHRSVQGSKAMLGVCLMDVLKSLY